jgi:hypothetical protein
MIRPDLLNDFAQVVVRRREPQKWSFIWRDVLGAVSCSLVLGSGFQFHYVAKHALFAFATPMLVVGILGLFGFVVGLIGLIRSAIHKRFALISLLGMLWSCTPVYACAVFFSLATTH